MVEMLGIKPKSSVFPQGFIHCQFIHPRKNAPHNTPVFGSSVLSDPLDPDFYSCHSADQAVMTDIGVARQHVIELIMINHNRAWLVIHGTFQFRYYMDFLAAD